MCRAIWALAIGPDEDTCNRIRRAAGADVQVIAMATNLERARELIGDTELDVAIIDASTPDAYGIVTKLRRSHPKVAIVWIGAEAPEIVHARVAASELDGDHIPSAVTKALIARRN
jgi:response regulator of citrate/malate metabolism